MTGIALYTMVGLTLLTALLIYLIPKVTKIIPAPLGAIGIVSFITIFFSLDTKTVADLGVIGGSLPSFQIPVLDYNFETFRIITPYALLLAAIGLIETLLTLNLIDDMTETRGRPNRESMAQGAANILTGFFGGMGGCAMIGQSMININNGALKRLSGIKNEGRPFKSLDLADIVKLPNGKEYVFNPQKGMFIGTDGTYPGGQEEIDPNSRSHKELLRLRKNQANRFKGVKEDAEGDASQVAVSKMIAKALGDENRWTEMSAAELYAELESTNTEMADMVKDVAKMIYGVQLAESKRDTHCSDKCCGADVKADDCECSSDCPHCNCNRDYVDNKNLGHPDGVTSDEEDKLHGRIHKIREDEITLEDNQDFNEEFGVLGFSIDENDMFEAEYQGRKVKLNKPMRGDVKKFKVYVKDPKTGNVKKVNFGHGGTSAKRKTMRIRKSNPKARKSFRARHNCDNPGPKTKARYWSCRKW